VILHSPLSTHLVQASLADLPASSIQSSTWLENTPHTVPDTFNIDF
jgi:hypothetical protein